MKLEHLFCICLILSLSIARVIAEKPADMGSRDNSLQELDLVSNTQALDLVYRFAPTLVFHPEERYFPCSPLFPLENIGNSEIPALERLGTVKSRKAHYLGLSLEEKARLARVFYRVRELRIASEKKLIIDYWFYYVWNDYRVRGGLFPLWFDRSHPNDLEHIHVVLGEQVESETEVAEPDSPGHLRLEAIHSSAHEGRIPSNRYYPKARESQMNSHFLVELGSHASAPDANRDGVFTPGLDGHSGYKLLWGVRDKGLTWAWYRTSYARPRSRDEAIFFAVKQGVDADGSTEAMTYELVSADELAVQFTKLGMSDEQRNQAFESNVHWLKKSIGKSSGETEKLLAPPDSEAQGDSIGLNGFSSTERGFILGGTTLADSPGLFLGGRYSFLHGISYLPDLIFELDGILTTRGKGYLSPQFCLAYPISVSTKLMGGAGMLTATQDLSHRQWEWLAGMEVRLGHLQIYAGFRSGGSVNDEKIDIRLAYFF